MKTKTLRLPVLFASAGALVCTIAVARAADASLEVRQDQSTTQKEVINEPSGADRSYSTRVESGPVYGTSYSSQTYESGAPLDPDAENDRLLHMYQRGRQAAESLDMQVKPNPIVVLPGATSVESYRTSQTFQHPSELHQQSYSSGFNEPAAAERESTTTTHEYSTSGTADTTSSTAALSSGTTVKASDLMGMSIKNDQGERIGNIKDVVVDLKNGRVAYAVVAPTGIADLGDKWLAVPPTVFSRTGTEKTLTWNIDKEKLRTAPTIDKHNWNAALQQDYIGNVYSFYGVQGYESEVSEPAGSQKKDIQFHHDSEHQNQDQKLERQDRDQSRNDASRSDVSGQSAGASSQSSEQSDLQKSQPEKSASSSADVSKEAAGAQPSASGSYSSSPSSSSSSSSEQSSSELKSSTDVNAPAGAQSSTSTESQNQPSSSSSSSSQNLNESAGATTSATTTADTSSGALPDRVQMALKNDASLSGSAQNVKFSMENDKLVIKGTVKSEDEKNRIMEKVRSTAGSTEIDDQLKVSSSSDSNSSSDNDNSSDSK